MDIAGIIAILSSLLGIPLIVFGFIFLNLKGKRSIELLRLQKEILKLELEKDKVKISMLEAENIKYDRVIRGPETYEDQA